MFKENAPKSFGKCDQKQQPAYYAKTFSSQLRQLSERINIDWEIFKYP